MKKPTGQSHNIRHSCATHFQYNVKQADIKGFTQPAISRIEGRTDIKLSTLIKYLTQMELDMEIKVRPRSPKKGVPKKTFAFSYLRKKRSTIFKQLGVIAALFVFLAPLALPAASLERSISILDNAIGHIGAVAAGKVGTPATTAHKAELLAGKAATRGGVLAAG